jgi:para-nitrobenzyl esterase
MNMTHRRRARPAAACCAALAALALAAAGATATASRAAAASRAGAAPIATTDNGAVRGVAAGSINEFLGIPYAAPPTGNVRWRPPQPPARWQGVRDATQFAPSCPQPPSPFAPHGAFSEDCLYLNVYAPMLRNGDGDGRPVLVWIHGGGLTEEGSSNYDGAKLAADGAVVVTINYRLGALGFLAHPALASRPGGPAGNYGLMDQQAALRWVQDNIGRFGGNPDNVTIAGQSAGGLSVLAQLVSTGARGLFQKAIIESGAFALNQQPLAAAKAAGEAFAAQAGCPDQTAACLRHLPVSDLVSTPFTGIPGVVDGKVLTEPIGAALAAGRFARVPVLNGTNHDEERLFVDGLQVTVSGGTFAPIPDEPVGPDNYQANIAAVLGVSADRAAAIAAEYPPSAYPPSPYSSSEDAALSALVGDANFACRALQVDQETSARVPTFAYEFNDDNAPQPYTTRLHNRRHARIRTPVPVRPAQRALPPSAQPRPADTRGQHASSLGELRRHRQPRDRGPALARIRRQPANAVARPAPATTRDRLRSQAPLRILGRRIATPLSPHALPAAAPTSAAAGRGKESAWPVRCRLTFSAAGTSRYPVARGGMTAPLPPGRPVPRR